MINKLFKKAIKRHTDSLIKAMMPALETEIATRLRPVIIAELDAQRQINWKDKCEWIFYHEDKNYYRYHSIDMTHIKRFERSSANMILLGNRLNHDELQKLAGIGKLAIEKCMNVIEKENRIKHVAKALWVFSEIEQRREALMFHPDIMLDLLATNLIREDEDPKEINLDIHNQKIQMLKGKVGDIPFLTEASLSDYLPDTKKLIGAIESTWEQHREMVQLSNQAYQRIHTELKSEII